MELTDELISGVRSRIIDELRFLSDPAAQLRYERDVPIAQATAELFCRWFDDSYHPDSPAHVAAFSEAEREVLAGFNSEFERVNEKIGKPPARVAERQSLRAWSRLIVAARRALSAIKTVAG